MAEMNHRVFVATLNYESALLSALTALDAGDVRAQRAARTHITHAIDLLKSLTAVDRRDALICLLQRRRISEEDWARIEDGMKSLRWRKPAQ
jgi:hypothetical protein